MLLIATGIAITVVGAAGGAAVGWYGTFLVRGAANGDRAVMGVVVGVCLLLLFCVGLRWMWLRLSDRPERVRRPRRARQARREPRAPVAIDELSTVNLWDVRPPQPQDTEPGRPAASPSR